MPGAARFTPKGREDPEELRPGVEATDALLTSLEVEVIVKP
jgi:hypothetical protein